MGIIRSREVLCLLKAREVLLEWLTSALPLRVEGSVPSGLDGALQAQ